MYKWKLTAYQLLKEYDRNETRHATMRAFGGN